MAKSDDRPICPRMFESKDEPDAPLVGCEHHRGHSGDHSATSPTGVFKWKDTCFRCGGAKKVSMNYQLQNLVCDACRAVFKSWPRPEYLAYEKQIRAQEQRKAAAREARRRRELTPEARAQEDRDNATVSRMFGSLFSTR